MGLNRWQRTRCLASFSKTKKSSAELSGAPIRDHGTWGHVQYPGNDRMANAHSAQTRPQIQSNFTELGPMSKLWDGEASLCTAWVPLSRGSGHSTMHHDEGNVLKRGAQWSGL